MSLGQPARIVHLELHTHDLSGASTFYGHLLRWRTKQIHVRSDSYHALTLGGALDGGIVECGATRPTWLPYVVVEELEAMTERGRRLAASVLLEPREGPEGWRSVLATSEGGEIALWQPKQCFSSSVLTLRGALIDQIDAFHDPSALAALQRSGRQPIWPLLPIVPTFESMSTNGLRSSGSSCSATDTDLSRSGTVIS